MGVYVGYILKTKTFFLIRLKQLLLVIIIIIIFKMYHSLTLKFICLKLNNYFVEHGQLYRCMLKYNIWLTFFQRLFNVKLVKVRLIWNDKAFYFQQISIIKLEGVYPNAMHVIINRSRMSSPT